MVENLLLNLNQSFPKWAIIASRGQLLVMGRKGGPFKTYGIYKILKLALDIFELQMKSKKRKSWLFKMINF